jgi:hypothetical protein
MALVEIAGDLLTPVALLSSCAHAAEHRLEAVLVVVLTIDRAQPQDCRPGGKVGLLDLQVLPLREPSQRALHILPKDRCVPDGTADRTSAPNRPDPARRTDPRTRKRATGAQRALGPACCCLGTSRAMCQRTRSMPLRTRKLFAGKRQLRAPVDSVT